VHGQFNPDDPHDGHAAVDGGFTYRMVHIWPEFLASLTGTPLPLFRSPVIEDPAMAASVRRLHRVLTGPDSETSELERYERLAGTARLLVRHASGREPTRRGAGRLVAARIRELIQDSAGKVGGGELTADDLARRRGAAATRPTAPSVRPTGSRQATISVSSGYGRRGGCCPRARRQPRSRPTPASPTRRT
jgi:hypothetical protein